MTSKLIPSNPNEVTVIRKITENIVTFSAPFSRFGFIKIGGRGTAVRLRNGSVAVFSPTALTPAVRETVQKLGEVKYISALDFEHHIFIGDWHKEYPSAKVIGVEGLEEKRKKSGDFDAVHFDFEFTPKNKTTMSIDPDFDSEFEYEYVDGHMNKELVFCHKPDRTLIEADLMFNLPANEQYSKAGPNQTPQKPGGILTSFFSSLNNTEGNAIWQRRFIWYGVSGGDRPSFNKSMSRIAGWDFDRIVPCHGDVIEGEGKSVFMKVMQWHIEAHRKGS